MLRARIAAILLLVGCSDGGGLSDEWAEAFDAGEVGWFLNVWGTGSDNLYAVGGTPSEGVLYHSDGGGWEPVDLGMDVPLLTWAHGFGPDDITVVGYGGTVIHWDGTEWSQQPTPTDENLWGVWGAAPDQLWAVGGRGRSEGEATLLEWDGTAWSQVQIPELTRANVYAFFKVWGTGADNVYVVGQRGAVLHYDGSAWSEELVGASDDLISLWGTGPDNVVAVGGRGNGIVSLWDGTEWRTESLAPVAGLNGVWMEEPGVAHVAGTVGTVGELDLETLELEQAYPSTSLDFHSVFGANGRLVSVGGNLGAGEPPYRGIAFERGL